MATTREKHDSVQRGYASARKLQEETLESHRHLLGEVHPDTLTAMTNLAVTLGKQGDWAGARNLQEQVLAASRRLQGGEHPHTLTAMSNLAVTLGKQGNLTGSAEASRTSAGGLAAVCWARNIRTH
jgi:hypothetical protein